MLFIVWEEGGWQLEAKMAPYDLHLGQDCCLESRLLTWQNITKLHGHDLILLFTFTNYGSLASRNCIIVALPSLLNFLDLGLHDALVNANFELGERCVLL